MGKSSGEAENREHFGSIVLNHRSKFCIELCQY
jgi:hypothetical protein